MGQGQESCRPCFAHSASAQAKEDYQPNSELTIIRKHEDILFDINNWKNSGVHGTSHELAAIAETLLDIRELLMLQQEVFDPIPSTPCICYDLLGKINPNCPIHNPVSEKDSVEKKSRGLFDNAKSHRQYCSTCAEARGDE